MFCFPHEDSGLSSGLILLAAVLPEDHVWWFRGKAWTVAQTCMFYEEASLIFGCSCHLNSFWLKDRCSALAVICEHWSASFSISAVYSTCLFYPFCVYPKKQELLAGNSLVPCRHTTALAHLSQHTVQKYQYSGESLADDSHPLYSKTIYEKLISSNVGFLFHNETTRKQTYCCIRSETSSLFL